MEITIVGAGHYGKLIVSKYEKDNGARIKAVVSPHKNALTSRYPFFTSAQKWQKKFGHPTSTDVFDLCVHPQAIPVVLREFIAIGGKNFILPKPVAVSGEELKRLKTIVAGRNLRIVIASQWHYSTLLTEIKEIIGRIKKGGRIEMNFSQSFDEKQKKQYSPLTALLPHMLQIVQEIGVPVGGMNVRRTSKYDICVGRKGVADSLEITLKSNIDHSRRTKQLAVFLSGRKKPILQGDLGGFSRKDKERKPHFLYQGKVHEEKKDLLETMVHKEIKAFGHKGKGWDKNVLSLRKYLPIAEAQVLLEDNARHAVAVVGGGIFGLLAGLAVAEKGYPVILFEKNSDIFLGASLVNQCRVHMGYHYPRDERTAIATLAAQESFCKTFPEAIVKKDFENYYCFAREGSLVTKSQCLAFCKKLGLRYAEVFPKKVAVAKEKIEFSLKVPERIFDAHKVKQHLLHMVDEIKNMEVLVGAEVVGIAREKKGYQVSYQVEQRKQTRLFSGIINATYSDINNINKMLRVPLSEYQYELCEMPVVKVPWKGRTGVAIMDGPFCGIMPFGFSKEYLLYDVELSVLDRQTSVFPNFRFGIPYYDTPQRREKRFRKIIGKMGRWFPQLQKAVYLYSIYATRIVLPRRDASDARPTVISNPAPGVWSIFSGKITTSIPSARELADKVDHFIKHGE
jgi:predicted dehydrogenase